MQDMETSRFEKSKAKLNWHVVRKLECALMAAALWVLGWDSRVQAPEGEHQEGIVFPQQ